MNLPAPDTRPALGLLARQVSTLIARARAGDVLDIEHTGHAYDVQQALRADLAAQPDLCADIALKIESFARKTGTAGIYAHLVITDTAPDLGEYDPSQIFLYDGVQDSGTDFSSTEMRSTIYGTVMTSVSMTDLAAYFRAGQKRQLVLHLGTDREQDLKALERMLAHLPAMLAATGMDKAAIDDVIAAIKSGNLPPATLKALHVAAEISALKTMPATPEVTARIKMLGETFTKLMATKAPLNGIALALASALTRMEPVMRAIALNPALPLSAVIRAQNDNRPGGHEIRNLIATVRAQRTELKSMSPAERRELAAVLRDLRASLRQQPARLQTGMARMNKLLAKIMIKPALASVVKAILPTALAATARFSTPALMAAFRTTLAPLIAQPAALPAPVRTALRTALASPVMARGNRQLATMLAQHPVISHSIRPQPLATNILSAPASAIAVPLSMTASSTLTAIPSVTAAVHTQAAPVPPASGPVIVIPPAADAAPAKPDTVVAQAAPPETDNVVVPLAKDDIAPVAPEAVNDAPPPADATPPVADAPATDTLAPAADTPPAADAAPDITPDTPVAPAPNQPATPDCCDPKVAEAVSAALGETGKDADMRPAQDGSIVVTKTDGTTLVIDAETVRENVDAHAKLTQEIAEKTAPQGPTAEQQQAWDSETLATLKSLKSGTAPKGLKETFAHECGDGCAHDHGIKTPANPAQEANVPLAKNQEIELVKKDPSPATTQNTRRRARTIQPK